MLIDPHTVKVIFEINFSLQYYLIKPHKLNQPTGAIHIIHNAREFIKKKQTFFILLIFLHYIFRNLIVEKRMLPSMT